MKTDQEKIKHYDYLSTAIDILYEYDAESDWYLGPDMLLMTNMNDILERGGSDAAILEPGDLDLLKECLEQARQLDETSWMGEVLFHVRKQNHPVCKYNIDRWKVSKYPRTDQEIANRNKMLNLLSFGKY